MRFVSILAPAAALAIGGFAATGAVAQRKAPPAAAAASTEPQPKITNKAFIESAQKVMTALEANDVATAKTAFAAVSPTTDDERYVAGQVAVALGQKAQDNALVAKGMELYLASSLTPAAIRPRVSFVLGQLSTDPAQRLKLMTEGYAGGYRTDGVEASLAMEYYNSGDLANGDSWMKRATEAMLAAGRSPLAFYAYAVNANVKANNLAGAQAWTKLLVNDSLVPDHWHAAIYVARRALPNADLQVQLDYLRLLRRVNGLASAAEYGDYIGIADARRLPGEVSTVIAEGKSRGKLTGSEPFVVEAQGVATARTAPDKASLANADRDAGAASTGTSAAAAADAFLGYGDYAHALSLYQTALAKGGVDAGRVNARIGIAKVGAGDLSGAEAAFKAVTAGPWKGVADYWLLYLHARSTNAPTTMPAAAAS